MSENDRIVYVDQQGQKIADSDHDSSFYLSPNNTNNTSSESSDSLRSVKKAINGQSGTMTEMINGTKMLVSYHPVKAFSNVWAILLIRPYNDI
ncbi:MAG: hypothetical protein M3270_01640 [Thermoproteota archaeon]|nr:hypothetical protein [Thermoproteota archaeon]